MNSAIIFIKNHEEAVLSNNKIFKENILCRATKLLNEAGIEDIYLIANEEICSIENVKRLADVNDLSSLLDPDGKSILLSPFYPFIKPEQYKQMLEVEDKGAVITDDKEIAEVFMVPNRLIADFEKIEYESVKVPRRKMLKIRNQNDISYYGHCFNESGNDFNDIAIFALSGNTEMVDEICAYLDTEPGKISISHFADGETLVELGETVRGKKVYFVQSTCKPVNEKLMELLIAVDAAKRSSAAEIICVMPYYGYARQDRKAKPRQPITAKLVADMLEAAGASRVVTFDLHAAQIQGFFSFPADDLTTVPLVGRYFLNKGLDMENVVVVSPDHGGATRARKLAEILGTTIAIVDKRRPRPNVCEAQNVIGDIEGKNVIVVDDICDTAGSMVAACQLLKDKGAKDIYVAVAHGVLSGPAIERIENSVIKEFVITNTIPLAKEVSKKTTKITVLSIAWMLANLINAISLHTPVSQVYDIFEKQPEC